MSDQSAYLYAVNNMAGCAIGVSDYGFSCVVYADSEDQARDWGITVAIEYAAKFGFPPHNLHPNDDEIVANSTILACTSSEGADHSCTVGQFPDSLR